MTIEVTLEPFEVEMIGLFSKRVNDNWGRYNQTLDGGADKYQVNPHAFGGEMALAKLMNRYPDWSISRRQGGADFLYTPNVTMDAKQTPRLDGNLVANINKKIGEADIYVLVIGKLPTYQVIGFAFEHELIRPESVQYIQKNGEEIPIYFRERYKLYPIEWLIPGQNE